MQIHDLQFEPYISSEKIQERIIQLGKELNNNFAEKDPIFIIVLNGAFIFAADLIRIFNGNCETIFTRIKSYTGTISGEIQTFNGINHNVKNRHIIFVEDIIDTGKTIFHLHQEIEKLEPASVTTITLLQKNILRPNLIKADLIGFEIPDVFVVGYGLDYEEKGRNLDGIWKVRA
ncbi:MAG: hypoxanthine phosphoribosyltransferase [Bacteroidetes bacterium]|nr:hypoxanthine phosphoribosyltransferase [Bacteroidota bacterium]